MRASNLIVVFALLLLSVPLVSCRVVIPGPLPADAGPEVQRDAGYTLLVNVLKDESSVAGLLSIKTVPKKTASIIRMIAARSKEAVKKLKSLAASPPAINIKNSGLPLVEVQARTWIANRTTVALLGSKGLRMEYSLLLSQLKATSYISALSSGLLKAEPSEERRLELQQLQQQFADLYTALFNRLMTLKAVEPTESESSS